MKIIIALAFALSATSALAEPPTNCTGHEKAWLANVRWAAGKGVKSIKKTSDKDPHGPEYDVTMKNGEVLHVVCDDSGDDDCQCQVDDGKK